MGRNQLSHDSKISIRALSTILTQYYTKKAPQPPPGILYVNLGEVATMRGKMFIEMNSLVIVFLQIRTL